MTRAELISKAIWIAESDMEIALFNSHEEIVKMTEAACDEALEEYVGIYEEEYGVIPEELKYAD